MRQLSRRNVLALGAAAGPGLAISASAVAETYGPDEGTELMPGIREVKLSESEAVIPSYSTVSMRDIVIEPGAEIDPFPMENDMVCHILEGELTVIQDGEAFTAQKGDVWTCATGTEEGGRNASDRVAIMRVTDLLRT